MGRMNSVKVNRVACGAVARGALVLAVMAGLMPSGAASALADDAVNAVLVQQPEMAAVEEDGDSAAAPAAGEIQGNGWKLDANGVFTLTADVFKPEKDDPKAYEWFAHADKIKEIRVAEGVTTIPWAAFNSNYPNLTKVTMSSTVKRIENSAFGHNENLAEVNFNDGLEYVGHDAFASTGLTSLKLPDNVTWGGDVFTHCDKITGTLVIPGGSKWDGWQDGKWSNAQFYGIGVDTVIIEEGVTGITEQFLSGCKNLKYVYLPKSLTGFSELGDTTEYWTGSIPACAIIGYKGTFAEKYVEHWLGVGSDWTAGMSFHAIDGDEHAYGAWSIIEPVSCESGGLQKRTCAICGAEQTQPIGEPTGHSWDEGTIVKEPTATAEGTKEFHCHGCGTTKTEAIARLGTTTDVKTESKKDAPATGVLPQTGDASMLLAGMTMLASAGTFAAAARTKKRR